MSSASRTPRRTKIIATIGPATRSRETMTGLIEAGADLFRLNFSHGTRAEHAENVARARDAAEGAGKHIGILGDLPGAKLRLADVAGGRVELRTGRDIVLSSGPGLGTPERLTVSGDGLATMVQPGAPVFVSDGKIRLRVDGADDTDVRCRIEVGGPVSSHQGLNVPDAPQSVKASGQDLDWVDFAVEHEIDLLAVSFVREVEDLEAVKRQVLERGGDIPLIAKIEKPEAAERADEIVPAATAGVMVARGDLGIELAIEKVPAVQRRLLALAGRCAAPSITATQMLASMVSSPRPTRAEVSDVANAISQGTDAVMLSEETAVGDYPIEAVAVMDRIARETEPELPYGDWLFNRVATHPSDVAGSVARAAVGSTYTLGLAALVVPTESGRTARLVSAHRPRVPVLAVSPKLSTVRRLNLLFGVRSVLADDWDSLMPLFADCGRLVAQAGLAVPGDLVGITAGLREQKLGTNLFEVHRVE